MAMITENQFTVSKQGINMNMHVSGYTPAKVFCTFHKN